MMVRAFPASQDKITSAWLNEVLLASGALRMARIVRHVLEPIADRGMASTVVRIDLEYQPDEEGAPRSVVAKFASPHEPTRGLMQTFGMYVNEASFYRDIARDAGIDVPHCHFVGLDPQTSLFVLLLEDIRDAREIDGETLDLEDAELVVRNLARFHARWWDSPHLEKLDWLWKPDDEERRQRMKAVVGAALPQARQRLGRELPETLRAVTERWLTNFDRIDAELRRGPMTLNHGDFHVAQMFFPSATNPRFAVFDWQLCFQGSGGNDLARFTLTTFPPEQREAHETRLVTLYHQGLLEHGVGTYPLEQCWEDYRLGMMTTAVMGIATLAYIDEEAVERRAEKLGMDLHERVIGWPSAALEYHGVLDRLG